MIKDVSRFDMAEYKSPHGSVHIDLNEELNYITSDTQKLILQQCSIPKIILLHIPKTDLERSNPVFNKHAMLPKFLITRIEREHNYE